MTSYQFHDDSGKPLDAHFEVREGTLILHSRGGAIGSPNVRNTEYSPALRILLKRIDQSALTLTGAWVDSARVQNLPEEERQIFSPEDSEVPLPELFRQLSKKMAAVGRDPNSRSRGNSNKKLRFAFAGNPPADRITRVVGWGEIDIASSQSGSLDEIQFDKALPDEVPPNPDDRAWAEGHPRLMTHLRRERKAGLAPAKKAAFIREHGRLRCERCGLDPAETYGPDIGDACIEVHHKLPVANMLPGHTTRLEDLMCVCANCHRIIHYELRNAAR